MHLATPSKASDQVASLIGVTPALRDQGQPLRLALVKPDTRLAQAAPAPARQEGRRRRSEARSALPVQVAQVPAPSAQPLPVQVAQRRARRFSPGPGGGADAAIRRRDPSAGPAAGRRAASCRQTFGAGPRCRRQRPIGRSDDHGADRRRSARSSVGLRRLHAEEGRAGCQAGQGACARAAPCLPQLGLGGSTRRLSLSAGLSSAAWSHLTQRYPALRAYLPLRARFDLPKGTFWRLSIQGFDTQREALSRCQLLKSRGGACFVRNFAGDAPVQYASR